MNKPNKQLQARIDNAMRQRRFIRTPRLMLMPLAVSDAPQVFAWTGDPVVNKYLIYNLYHSVEEVERWLASIQNNETLFGIFLSDGTLIGSADCSLCGRGNARELGYNLHKAYWGKGYATETCLALIAYTAEKYDTQEFYVLHAVENARSQRVIEKCGFTFDKMGTYQKQDGSQTFESRHYTLHVDLHQMNLDDGPFKQIASGNKTIEMRLNDERRQCLKVGDFVTFTDNESGEKLIAKVVDLHKFADFDELYKTLDLTKCGYTVEQLPSASPRDMLRYYPAEKQAQYGALGIEIQTLCIL